MPYKLKKDFQGITTLFHPAGLPMVCPFRAPFVGSHPETGRPQLMDLTCTDLCPHFRIHEDVFFSTNKMIHLSLTCGRGTRFENVELEDVFPPKKPTPAN